MASLEKIVSAVLEYGPGAVFIVFLLVIAIRAGHVLADNYTRPVAETVWLTLANWTVAVVAVALARWAPQLAETIDEQLEYLESYNRDGITGFRLLWQAAVLARNMRRSAVSKGEATVRRGEMAQPSDEAAEDETADEPIAGSMNATLPVMTTHAPGHLHAPKASAPLGPQVTFRVDSLLVEPTRAMRTINELNNSEVARAMRTINELNNSEVARAMRSLNR